VCRRQKNRSHYHRREPVCGVGAVANDPLPCWRIIFGVWVWGFTGCPRTYSLRRWDKRPAGCRGISHRRSYGAIDPPCYVVGLAAASIAGEDYSLCFGLTYTLFSTKWFRVWRVRAPDWGRSDDASSGARAPPPGQWRGEEEMWAVRSAMQGWDYVIAYPFARSDLGHRSVDVRCRARDLKIWIVGWRSNGYDCVQVQSYKKYNLDRIL
jgi:hypothetical protein